MDYDVAAAFEEIEADLIESMMRNLKRHRAEEDELGINWSQWQAEQLKALEEYKIRNAKKYGTKFNDINATLDGLIRKYREDGNTEQEVKILEAIKKGFKAEKAAPGVSAKFFKMNDRKIDALVRATTNDFKKAEAAILRRSNDQYRKIIFKAQMYAHMGGTYEKAVDMATKDFLRNGLKCVVYKNGSQHSLQDYADMALRTAQKRAYLTGEGEKRKEWGISTVIVNKRGNPCPLCAKWVGKVLVDDVWSGGSKDGKSNVTGVKYKTVSQAIKEGLYHPRCRDSHTTYFEGINTMPAEGYTREELKKLAEEYKGEQQQQYAERQAESYNRLAEYSLDEDNRRIYRARAEEWEDRVKDGGGVLENYVAKDNDSDTMVLRKSVEVPDECKHLLKADTNFHDKNISVEILRTIDSAIEEIMKIQNDFEFKEIKIAKFGSGNEKSVFITNLETRGMINNSQLYLNKLYFIDKSLEQINAMCMESYEKGWWKSKELKDLVNHEIMHARINYHNSYEAVERLYDTLKNDKRVLGFCRLVDNQPDEFLNEMYVAINNAEEIDSKYMEVYNEYVKEFLGD